MFLNTIVYTDQIGRSQTLSFSLTQTLPHSFSHIYVYMYSNIHIHIKIYKHKHTLTHIHALKSNCRKYSREFDGLSEWYLNRYEG